MKTVSKNSGLGRRDVTGDKGSAVEAASKKSPAEQDGMGKTKQALYLKRETRRRAEVKSDPGRDNGFFEDVLTKKLKKELTRKIGGSPFGT